MAATFGLAAFKLEMEEHVQSIEADHGIMKRFRETSDRNSRGAFDERNPYRSEQLDLRAACAKLIPDLQTALLLVRQLNRSMQRMIENEKRMEGKLKSTVMTFAEKHGHNHIKLQDLSSRRSCEAALWQAHVHDLQRENARLEHEAYLRALNRASDQAVVNTEVEGRSETRTLRQQLACMDERWQSVNSKMARMQEQVVEAQRLLSQERQERLEERNQQLTVVVAKHGLERRMRNREQDLQAEWQKNADLTERCRLLEEELAKRDKAICGHIQDDNPPSRDTGQASRSSIEVTPEDDWDDTPSHVPPEFAYSKSVRRKRMAREGHERAEKRQKLGNGWLQLAGSESPPSRASEEAGPGANAIDHMVYSEFTESESPSRVNTPVADCGTRSLDGD